MLPKARYLILKIGNIYNSERNLDVIYESRPCRDNIVIKKLFGFEAHNK